MSQPRPAQPAKLVVALLLGDKGRLSHITGLLQDAFGALDMVSPWMAFNYTHYYQSEMGAPLFRRVLAFKHLIHQRQLAQIKCHTNEVEQTLAVQGQRCVNIDPGYLLHERFVLATGKNYAHRIYIGNRIYADLTLVYQEGGYQPLPWTYPDYKADEMQSFLLKVRKKYGADVPQYVQAGHDGGCMPPTVLTPNCSKGEIDDA